MFYLGKSDSRPKFREPSRVVSRNDGFKYLLVTDVPTARPPAQFPARPPAVRQEVDPLGFEPRAFRMRSGCDATTP